MEQGTASPGTDTTAVDRHRGRAPILVSGAARSGTTLVYHILLSSGAFPIYRAEPKIPQCALRYPPLSTTRGKRKFEEAFLKSFQFERSGLDPADLEALVAASNSYDELLAGFGDEMATRQGKARWTLKVHPYFAARLLRVIPDSKLVHVIRDGRDASVSRLRLGWGTPGWIRDRKLGLIWCAKYWEWQVKTIRDGIVDPSRCHEVRYEDLVREPDRVLSSLGEFAGCDVSVQRLRENPVGSLERPNSSFDTGAGDLLSAGSVGRWAEKLSREEGRILEASIARTLDELGYERERAGSSRPRSRMWDLLTGVASFQLHNAKWWAKQHTPLRRFGASPLEPMA